jgi:hypothetical protein
MRELPINAFRTVASLAIILSVACAATPPHAQTCRADCRAPIELPDDLTRSPSVPEVTRVAGGEVLDFPVSNRTGERGRTVLAFQEAAFVDRQGNPIYTLELQYGSNRFETRPYRDGVCRAPDGCRYVVINIGSPTRPAIIGSPIIIIDPR